MTRIAGLPKGNSGIFIMRTKGQAVLEYFIILGVIAIITVIALGATGHLNIQTVLEGYYDTAASSVNNIVQ